MTNQVLEKPKQTNPSPDAQNGSLSLLPGDYLTRPEFERRYHAQSDIKKAELIEGIVYIPSPVRAGHGDAHFVLIGWLGVYQAATPGVRGSDNATLRLDFLNEPQPDILLRLDPALGGRSRLGADGYLEGSPEFIVEIAASSASYDMNQKKGVYDRHGIQEYLVVLPLKQEVAWFVLRDEGYVRLQPDADGILRSQVFPGLWLQPAAIWTNGLITLLDVGQQGIASPEHNVFVEQLKAQS